jgi:DinB superfamily
MPASLPPLAAEDHVCAACGVSYSDTRLDDAMGAIAGLPDAVREVLSAISPEARRVAPGPEVWSVAEYLCHLRDVYVSFTIRLYRVRTEHQPALEPMFNDLRARRFRYNSRDVRPVLDELADAVAGCCDEADRFEAAGWDRVVTRLPGEERTARWLLRQALHEGVHHLGDLRAVAAAVGG